MEFFGYRIEKINADEALALERAREVLEKHGFRAVRKTTDTSKKIESAKRASESKTRISAEKCQNGLNLWRMEGNQGLPTAYRLAKLSNVSQNTAKKWLESLNGEREA